MTKLRYLGHDHSVTKGRASGHQRQLIFQTDQPIYAHLTLFRAELVSSSTTRFIITHFH